MALIGKEIKPFKADAYHNGEFINVSDEDLKGKWNVIMFYPADFTSVCNSELEDLQSNYENLKSLGVQAYSVSTDSHFTHKALHDSSEEMGKIAYPMIGDPSHILSRNFDVLDEEAGHANRATFIIDPDGVIQGIEISAGNIGRDTDALINKIKAAQFVRENPNQACPAKWKPEDELEKPNLDLAGKI